MLMRTQKLWLLSTGLAQAARLPPYAPKEPGPALQLIAPERRLGPLKDVYKRQA